MKIVFLGVPQFAAAILENLIFAGLKPVLVITEIDKPVGRKQLLTPPLVKTTALKHGLDVSQPKTRAELREEIAKINPDLAVVVAYGRLIPLEALKIPKYGFINVHPSLLPRWRGVSPIQHTVLAGDEETGVSIMLMDEIFDHGPVLATVKIKIDKKTITSEKLRETLTELSGKLLTETIPKWLNGSIKPIPQENSSTTYAKMLKKEDGKINWTKPAEEIERQVRAFNPWPGTFTYFEISELNPAGKIQGTSQKIIKIFKATVLEQTEKGPFGEPGKTYLAPNEKIAVQCGKDFLIIEELQIEGGKKMPTNEFLRGHHDFIGLILK